MPSPTSSTRPTSCTSSFERYCSISDCRTELISSALNLMTATRKDFVTDGFQSGADGGVQLQVAHANLEAAQKLRIDPCFEPRRPTRGARQLSEEAITLLIRQRCGAGDQHATTAGTLVVQVLKRHQGRTQQLQPVVIVQDQQEVEEKLAGPTGEDLLNDLVSFLTADRGTGQQHFDLWIGLEDVLDKR